MENKEGMKGRASQLTIRIGKTTYVIGMYFKEGARETMDDKVRKMIREDINNMSTKRQ